MDILILSQFYAPEPCAAANRVGALAAALVAEGHRVTVLTGMPSFPEGKIAPAYRGRRSLVETIDGVRVERVATYASDRLAGGNRVLNWLSVAAGQTIAVLRRTPAYDVVIASSPPITIALPALVARLAHRAPLVADVRDVFPEVAIAMGRWRRDAPVARIVGAVADAFYRAASLVVAVTPAARAEIGVRGVPDERLTVAANGFDRVQAAAKSPVEKRDGEFVVAYVGNMGLATGLDVVLDAAAALRDDRRIRFVLVGDGADAARLRARALGEALANVEFTGVLPRDVALRIVADAEATVVPLVATIRDSLPTKLFDAMAVGTPIVLSAAGEARRVVEESGAGIAVAPGDGAALAAAIARLADAPEERAAYAAAGGEYVRARYDRERIMRELAATVARLAQTGATALAVDPAPARTSDSLR